ncbi:MAG: hypothetical protein Kow0059_15820 [Candidatus Sumerlaeia bacterium]
MKRFVRAAMAALIVGAGLWGLGGAPAGGGAMGGEEKKVTLEELPAPVKEALQKAAIGGQIMEIEAEEEDGQMVYEAEVVQGSKSMEIEFGADGKILEKKEKAKDADEEDEEDEDEEEEVVVELINVPENVQEAIKDHAGTAAIEKVTKEKEDGVTVFEAEFKVNGMEQSVEVADNGQVLELERKVSADELPAAVKAALEKACPGGEIAEAELIQKFYYEIKVKTNGKTKEIKVTPAGKTGKHHGDDDADDDDHDDVDDDD